jgi:hypothetical protein
VLELKRLHDWESSTIVLWLNQNVTKLLTDFNLINNAAKNYLGYALESVEVSRRTLYRHQRLSCTDYWRLLKVCRWSIGGEGLVCG